MITPALWHRAHEIENVEDVVYAVRKEEGARICGVIVHLLGLNHAEEVAVGVL
jgi:hypothetical protein